MIPLKLAVRNFMPYRDNVPPLHFDGIHTASICGDNGNGKSALIDAMTWALWGEARGKSDDDLIHLGQTEMEVELEFAVEQQRYRVIRKHSRPKRQRSSGQTILEFQIASGDGFRSISDSSIRKTQQAINGVLHIDYPTFINSALLLQGRDNEFTVANPAKRKQVLADILGLSLYDQLEEQAKELAKEQEAEKSLLESNLADIGQELASKADYEEELRQAQGELSTIEAKITEQESALNELRQKREHLNNCQIQLTQLREHITETARALERWGEQVNQHHSRIKEYEDLLSRRDTIEAGYEEFVQTRKLNEELNQKLALVNRLNQGKHELEMTIERAQSALVTEHKLAESKIAELAASSQRLPALKDELQQIERYLLHLAEVEKTLHQKKQETQVLQTDINSLESGNARLNQELLEIDEKLGLLSNQTEARCPLCERELEMASLRLIETKFNTEKNSKSGSLTSNQVELARKQHQLQQLAGETSQEEDKLNQDRTIAQGKASILKNSISEVEKEADQLTGAAGRLVEIEDRLARKDFAATEQQALDQLEAEMARLDYSPEQHETVRHSLTDLEQYETPKRKLDEAERFINQEKDAALQAEQAAQELQQNMEDDNKKSQELTAVLESLPRVTDDLTRAETAYRQLGMEQKQAQETVGSIRGKLQRISETEIKKKEKEKALSQALKEGKVYRDLAEAFGKRGIQALLIEIALPEIEAVANNLLGRMTDNRMHVKFETQRETKKGDLLETLDINIADELGTRNYEMFSGGEAFRINFAIRIALSKLLAKRAGAPLPTLIVDEGFGTQDSNGLEKIKEAITSIQDDFEKIFIITHIEELRDAFPAHIDVIKTAEGSTIEVS